MSKVDATTAVDQAIEGTNKYMASDYPITPAGRLVVTSYRQAMREWLAGSEDPDEASMPLAEDWSKYEYDDSLTDTITQ